MGAALRRADPLAHRRRLPHLQRRGRRSPAPRRGASASAASPSPPRSTARAALGGPTDRPSIFGAIASGETADPRRRSCASARCSPSRARSRTRRSRARPGPSSSAPSSASATTARCSTATSASPRTPTPRSCSPTSRRRARHEGQPAEVPIEPDDALGNEWAVVIDAPGYAACLLAWEQPAPRGGRGAPTATAASSRCGRRPARRPPRRRGSSCTLAARHCPALAERLEALLADRPLAVEAPAPGLTALTNRLVAYLEA